VANKYTIESIFKLIDRVSDPCRKIGRALDSVGVDSKVAGDNLKFSFMLAEECLNKFVNKLGDKMSKFGKKATLDAAAGAVRVLGSGFAAATRQYMEFDGSLKNAGAIFSDLSPGALDFQSKLKNVGAEVRKVAAVTEFTAQEAAGALTKMAMAGIKSEQAVALLPKVADMATVAGVGLDTAVTMAAGSLGVFGLMDDDPLTLAQNMQHVSDIMVKTSSLASMSLSDMYGAVTAGGKEFTKANQSIEDFGAAVSVLASSGYTGSEAGKAISTMMNRLAAPAAKGQAAIQAFCLQTRDSRGNILNFVDIIRQLEERFKGMGPAEQSQYLTAIFGKEQYVKASAIISAGSDALRGYSEALRNAGGAAEEMAGDIRGSLQNRIAILKSSLTELGFKFLDAFLPKIGEVLDTITTTINNLDVTPFLDVLNVVIDTLFFVFGAILAVAKVAWGLRHVILALAVPFLLHKTILVAIALWTKIWAVVAGIARGVALGWKLVMLALTGATLGQAMATIAATTATTAATLAWTVTTTAATGAQTAFNAALLACPLVWIILLVVALIAVLILVISYWDEIVLAVLDTGILQGIIKIGSTIIDFILAPIQKILEVLAKLPLIGGAFRWASEKVAGWRHTVSESAVGHIAYLDHLAEEKRATIAEREAAGKTGAADRVLDSIGLGDLDISGVANPAACGGLDYAMGVGEGGCASGYAGSKIKGVVDISGGNGVVIAGVTNSAVLAGSCLHQAANTANPPVPSAQTLVENISCKVGEAVSFLEKICMRVESIVTSAYDCALAFAGGGTANEDDPRWVSPITQGERMAYSVREQIQRLVIEVIAGKGTDARVVSAPPDTDIKLVRSGGNA